MNRRPFRARRNRGLRSFEQLESRQLLTAVALNDMSPALHSAFENATDLSNYSPDQIASADRWIIAIDGETDLAELADSLGVSQEAILESSLIANTFIVDITNYDDANGTVPFVNRAATFRYAYPLAAETRVLRFVANDPLFDQQWNIHNTGQVTTESPLDHGFVDVWAEDITGDGIVVSIVDEGVELSHPDLSDNVSATISYDFLAEDDIPEPSHDFASHGTAVAGIIAARGGNDVGISGAAPHAQIGAIKLPFNDRQTDLTESRAVQYAADRVDIYNHSWGPSDNGVAEGPGPLFIAAIEQTIREGREGKGSIHVWAAGNGGLAQDDVNLDGYANLRYTIATTAIDASGRQASYSEPGAPIFISALSSNRGANIVSTDLTGERGLNAFADDTDGDQLADLDYTSNFGGTSAAAPLVSAAVALMLEANPALTWRDVQHVLARSAQKNHSEDSRWITNGAGFHVNERYGFGALDVKKAVDLARTWKNVGTEQRVTLSRSPKRPLNDDNEVRIPFVVNDRLDVEWVEVTVDAQHARRGDLEIVLTSPAGTESVLARSRDTDSGSYRSWVFTTPRNWGESSAGVWQLSVRDVVPGQTGQLEHVQLDIYGTKSAVLPDVSDPNDNDNDNGDQGGNNGGNDSQGDGSDSDSNGSGDSGGSGGDSNNGDNDSGSNGGDNSNHGGEDQGPDDVVTGSISGFVLQALADSTAGARRGVAGISVYLDTNGDHRPGIDEPQATTDAEGRFEFSKVPDGNYEVRMVPTPGWVAASSDTRSVRLRDAGEATTMFAIRSHLDYGDAPKPYATAASDRGAVHAIDDRLFLGKRVDADSSVSGNNGADYDDFNGTDDEDGILFLTPLIPGAAATVAVEASRSGILQGWIDFNADGDWSDPGEQVFVNRHVPKGQSEQVILVPRGVLPGTTYARFRLSEQIDVQPTGMAIGGEVEDYVVLIGSDRSEVANPEAQDDFLVVLEDSQNNALNVLSNDRIPLSGARIVSVENLRTRGVVLIGPGGGSIEYTPPIQYVGTDTFRYTIENIIGAKSTATVTVRIDDVVIPPTANDDQFVILADSNENTLNVLRNDSTSNGTLRIQSVTESAQGGAVSIAPNGKSIIYQPRKGYAGPDSLSYTTVDASGLTASATVSIVVSRKQQIAEFELVAEDAEGNELTNVRPGDQFILRAYATDLRSRPRGLFAAYFDVTFNPNVVEAVGEITHGANFDQVVSGTIDVSGRIDEVGGTGDITQLDGGRYLVFSLPIRAVDVGDPLLKTEPADIEPAHQVLMFGLNDPISSEQIIFGSSPLSVRVFTNATEPLDSNGDGSITPIDALLLINELNLIGARPLSRTLAVDRIPSFFADVNQDGAISPIDALTIINRLNSIKRTVDALPDLSSLGSAVAADIGGRDQDLKRNRRPNHRIDGLDSTTSIDVEFADSIFASDSLLD